ncbi:MAG: serine/threonine-protein kinase [Planctomycetaceae bacterium]
MPLTIEQFTQRLMSSGVITADELRESLGKVPAAKRPRDGEQLARELVKRKRLTAYQALEVYLGKGQSLVLGNYVVLDKLGEGGMGVVYKAEHRRMKRIVALKVISEEALKARGVIQRFEREVQAVAKLEHPNVVTAYDADQEGETHFLVMQYVEGDDLSAIVKKSGPLTVDRAVDYVLQAARGLEFAHQNGVIHRDVKPHNMLLSKEGVVKILDLGLARVENPMSVNHETTLTSTGAVLGTIDYMSPEQAEDTRTADERSDIYSLGCTLFYLLTARVAYPGDTMMKRLLAHREAALPSLATALEARNREGRGSTTVTLDARLATLDTVFRRMIAKKPADRQPSMTEVITDLQSCLTAPVMKATPVMAVSEDSKLNDFLARISDPNLATSDEEVDPDAPRAVPFDDAPTIQFRGDAADTDPSTLTNVSKAAKHRRKRPAWWRDPVRVGILCVAALMLYAVWWLATSPSRPAISPNNENKKRETKPSKRRPTTASLLRGDLRRADETFAQLLEGSYLPHDDDRNV